MTINIYRSHVASCDRELSQFSTVISDGFASERTRFTISVD